MSTRKQDKAVQNLQLIWQLSKATSKEQMQWLLRCLLIGGKPNLAASGFVLPTVTMVGLVVVLLTTALMIRSFDRSRTASNFRVNETVLNAATPALDRASAKINALLTDPTLQEETPKDAALEQALNKNSYILGDETRLRLANDTDKNGSINRQNNETLDTAWKFPVDTDNNGKFDSYTLYGIYFRSSTRTPTQSRNPLAARTSPMERGLGSKCVNVAGTNTRLVGDSGWYKTGAKLTKSFYVYTAIVPITTPPVGDTTNYEVYKGNRSFSALEFQQDRSRIPLTNNAATFQNDLEIAPDSTFRLNGRISTNGNLLIGSRNVDPIELFQVSSDNSCFYTEDNSKITVGGNVAVGGITDTRDQSPVIVDLFNGIGNNPLRVELDRSTKSTISEGGAEVGYNDAAYNQRIALMKQTALAYHPDYIATRTTIDNEPQPTIASVQAVPEYPQEVKEGFADKLSAEDTRLNNRGLNRLNNQGFDAWDVLAEQIEIYLKNRTRRVPYAEVPTLDRRSAIDSYDFDNDNIDTSVFATSRIIEPPQEWREPLEANTELTLNSNNLPQTQPEKQQKEGKETRIGDRIYVGNNLPAFWKNGDIYVTGSNEKQLLGDGVNWTDPRTEPRYRTTQVTPLPDERIADRNEFWEDAAAQQPATNLANVGGLRVITGAGIYVDGADTASGALIPRATNSFLPIPTLNSRLVPDPAQIPKFTTQLITTNNDNIVVWSDSMPMTGGVGQPGKGDLQMRATAIYHYKDPSYTDRNYINRTPTACISSYYDPSDATTASNSDNGNVYDSPYSSDNGRLTAVSTYRNQLNRQARLVFPNGRIVNQPLRNALAKIDDNDTRSLADNSAIDTAVCALGILDGTVGRSSNSFIPNGAIKEASFIDARQVKAIDKTLEADKNDPISNPELNSTDYNVNDNYNLALEQRQPLEVRVTDIDLRQLAETEIGGTRQQEYILPNSGIIYASRDDALSDLSDINAENELLSPTDFKLDPTRRPNGIRLINGSNLERDNDYREEEKGLILATNLPAYIKGNFNLHQESGTNTPIEEFFELLRNTWINFYSRDDINNNFACRRGQPGCGSNGDQWRPATIISDAMTVLSNNFVDGFRNQGDYDIRNNAGNLTNQEDRRKNGFFDNSFVTSFDWANGNNFPINSRNSYLTNGVTPIQRRTNFSEYLMEVCPKLPVETCGPGDWYVKPPTTPSDAGIKASGIIGQDFDINNYSAGTTAQPAAEAYQRYPRRVAFKRDGNNLEVTLPSGNNVPTPKLLGLDSAGKVQEFPYETYSTKSPRQVANALWFRTTTSTSGRAYENPNYRSDNPLAYTQDTQLISPPTPEITGVSSLNSPANNAASSYIICTRGGSSKTYLYSSSNPELEAGNCDSGANSPFDAIAQTLNELINLDPTDSNTDEIVEPDEDLGGGTTRFEPGRTTTFRQTGRVNVIDLNSISAINTINSGPTTIKLEGNEDSIFVFQKDSGNLDFASDAPCGGSCSRKGVVVDVGEVNPNNVFWALGGTTRWNEVDESKHQMRGNFLSRNIARLQKVDIDGRILGVNSLPSGSELSDVTIRAIPSDGQPLLIPVLQIHSPNGSPSGNSLDQGTANLQDNWLQTVDNDTTVNAVFVSGNSPSRLAEKSAGLPNFVRLLENWDNRTLDIKGSFIQYKRSAYATAPFATILTTKTDDNDSSLSIFDYNSTQYKSQIADGTLPYFSDNTLNRKWIFDVGLLSQSPDLFGQKFTQQPLDSGDEFFRQVGRDDPWVKTLLCAVQNSNQNLTENNYIYAVDESERPNDCPAVNAYSDSALSSDSSSGE